MKSLIVSSRSFKHALVESLSIVVICYLNNYASDCVFPYFPIEWVDASRQSPATYLATDSLRLGCSCKRALTEGRQTVLIKEKSHKRC